MSDYRFPRPSDDFQSELTCTVAAEFIHRLDRFLQYWTDASDDGDVPIDVIGSVKNCCKAASDLLLWSDALPYAPREVPQLKWVPSDDALAVTMIGDATDVVRSLLEARASAPAVVPPGLPKWQLMSTLASEFFLRFGALVEGVLSTAENTVDSAYVGMLLGCLDGAIGMVYELDTAVWATGGVVPAAVILAMHDHVISHRLECAGPEAVQLINEVYEAVVKLVRTET